MKLTIAMLVCAFSMPVFAAKVKREFPKNRVPAGTETFDCSGTEPFWSLKISDKKVTFSDSGAKGKDMTGVKLSSPGATSIDGVMVVQAGSGDLSGFVESNIMWMVADTKGNPPPGGDSAPKAYCSDGMSDLMYPYSVNFFYKGHAYTGCCSTKSRPPLGQAGE